MRVTEIIRYPVKGFSPERIPAIDLVPGSGLPFDRAYAITHGASRFNRSNPAWVSRRNFLVLAHSPLIGSLSTSFDPDKSTITFQQEERVLLVVDVNDPGADEILDTFLAEYGSPQQPGPYRLAQSEQVNLTDSPTQTVSIMNLKSLYDVQKRTGWLIDKARFRGNIWLDGSSPWEERLWIGQTLRAGDIELMVTEEIVRCAAVDANPDKGVRDLSLLAALNKNFGQANFGVLAKVVSGGVLKVNDTVFA